MIDHKEAMLFMTAMLAGLGACIAFIGKLMTGDWLYFAAGIAALVLCIVLCIVGCRVEYLNRIIPHRRVARSTTDVKKELPPVTIVKM